MKRSSMLSVAKLSCLMSALILVFLSTNASSSEDGRGFKKHNRITFALDCYTAQSIPNRGSKDNLTISILDSNYKLVKAQYYDGGRPYVSDVQFKRVITDKKCGNRDGIDWFGDDSVNWSLSVPEVRNTEVQYIQISTSGKDAFWLDQLEVTVWNTQQGVWPFKSSDTNINFGVDGKKGYCLSQDPNDANGKWKNVVNQCNPCLEFNLHNGKATYNCGRSNELKNRKTYKMSN